MKICILFDEAASARSAEILIKHVASDCRCETQSLRFEELDPPGVGVAAARRAAKTDILVLAVRDDRVFPDHVRFWLGLCMGLRDDSRDGALVALIIKTAENTELDSSLADYLARVAVIGGLAFFLRQQNLHPDGATVPAVVVSRQHRRRDLGFSPHKRRSAAGCVNYGSAG